MAYKNEPRVLDLDDIDVLRVKGRVCRRGTNKRLMVGAERDSVASQHRHLLALRDDTVLALINSGSHSEEWHIRGQQRREGPRCGSSRRMHTR
jgi:hypothetical protein